MAPRSPSNDVQDRCEFCGAERETPKARASASNVSQHLCPKCQAPQPLRSDESYFTLLGVPRKFAQDAQALQSRFYELSRVLHPDRFTAAKDPRWKALSLERMSEINQAYLTLRDPDAILDYLLEKSASPGSAKAAEAKAKIPLDLAEEWFEIQDLAMENPADVPARLRLLKKTLAERSQGFESEKKSARDRFDAGDESALSALAKLRQDAAYLNSMQRDIQRLEARLGGAK